MQADAGCPNSQKQLKQQRQQRQRPRRLKNDLVFNLRTSREVEFIQFVYIVSEISQTEYVRPLQNSTKEILKIGRRKGHVLSNKQNWCAYFSLLFCEL